MKSWIKGQQFQMKVQIRQPKEVLDISNFPKTLKTVNLKTAQTCSEGKTKTKLMDPNNSRQGKNLQEGPKFQKLGKIVAAATIGDYLVNLDL